MYQKQNVGQKTHPQIIYNDEVKLIRYYILLT